MIDELVRFKFPEFTTSFLIKMKKEVGTLLALYKSNFNWSTLPGAAEYDAKLQEKIASNDNASDTDATSPAHSTWEDDPSEKARRIWEWWRIHHGKFVCFKKAVRLVALVQVSSAAAERVFSQLKLIL